MEGHRPYGMRYCRPFSARQSEKLVILTGGVFGRFIVPPLTVKRASCPGSMALAREAAFSMLAIAAAREENVIPGLR